MRVHNAPDAVVLAEEGTGVVARSHLDLNTPEAAEIQMASGPRVRVVNDGIVVAHSGIHASSTHGWTAEEFEPLPGDDVEIRVGENGLVLGLEGPAVEIVAGRNNQLINYGIIASSGEWTVRGGEENESIINRGMLVGSLDLGGGENALLNDVDGILAPGASVRLAGGALHNRGLLWPGFEEIQHTVIEGDLYLHGGSLYVVEIKADGRSDHVEVRGKATLDPGGGPGFRALSRRVSAQHGLRHPVLFRGHRGNLQPRGI